MNWLLFLSLYTQHQWSRMILLSSLKALISALEFWRSPWAWAGRVRNPTRDGSGCLGGACSTWVPRCVWVWTQETSHIIQMILPWPCIRVIERPPEWSGPGTAMRCWISSMFSFTPKRSGTGQPSHLQPNGRCMEKSRSSVPKHIKVGGTNL